MRSATRGCVPRHFLRHCLAVLSRRTSLSRYSALSSSDAVALPCRWRVFFRYSFWYSPRCHMPSAACAISRRQLSGLFGRLSSQAGCERSPRGAIPCYTLPAYTAGRAGVGGALTAAAPSLALRMNSAGAKHFCTAGGGLSCEMWRCGRGWRYLFLYPAPSQHLSPPVLA